MKSHFEKMIGIKVPCDYAWNDDGIVRIGAKRDIAAYAAGDFKGKCVTFLHGNGETAVSEKYLFDQLNERGVSVVAPDHRGYGLTCGEFSERGCFEVAHAAYDWLLNEKGVSTNGEVLPCLSLGGQFVEDNLRRRPLVEIWRDPNAFPRFRNKSAQLTGKCVKCPFGEVCKAGCSAMALSQTGTLAETPFCIRQLEWEKIIKEAIG